MNIKHILTKKSTRIAVGSSLFSSFSTTLPGMLINSKEIAQNVKTAIIEAGTQFSTEFKDVIETTKPLWPNKYSCLTSLGVICAAGGLVFLYQGFSQLINSIGSHEDTSIAQQGIARILTGLLANVIGISAIYIFGG